MKNKTKVRKELRRIRLAMSDLEHTRKSRAIVKNLKQAIDWSRIKTVHYFEPIKGLMEPDTSDFINYIEDEFPHIELYTPRKIEGKWELVSAKGGPVPAKFDVILVPMLGFDPKSLHRIGYGGGFYDKFLATQSKALKLGVSFDLGRVNDIPVESHDIALSQIITETSST